MKQVRESVYTLAVDLYDSIASDSDPVLSIADTVISLIVSTCAEPVQLNTQTRLGALQLLEQASHSVIGILLCTSSHTSAYVCMHERLSKSCTSTRIASRYMYIYIYMSRVLCGQ